ncbi:type I-E CRISPR-associated protein Cas5/CasD [bacterium]|nr:type I-E CRISPR-associated protein Cas5/CasD [bacterium]MBU1615962.1 type I-E CRISPR-associated protein Cas5/CasD [bacterium]
MSSDKRFLTLRLEGPLQSWGFDSQYNRRNTGLMPTKSAIGGMCCAAIGLSRGSDKEQEFLISFGMVRMTTIAIPRNGVKKELPVRRLQDYHTVQNTKTAEGKNKDCHITHRQYLTDAAFGVLLEGNSLFLGEIANALADPKWGIWLGRKTCIPSAPVFAGLKDNQDDALRLLIGEKPLKLFTRQEEVKNFAEGRDSLPDAPVSFATERRLFSPRRVRMLQGSTIRRA